MNRDSYSDLQAHASFQPQSPQFAIDQSQFGQPAQHSSFTSDVGSNWLNKASSWVADKFQTAQTFMSSGDAILQGRGYANAPDQILPALRGTATSQAQTDPTNQPLVGVIDSGFGANEHGSKMVEAIQKENPQAKIWQGGGVGTGGGLESLAEFVDVAKATGQTRAVANLSFDLTEVHLDGSTSTRAQLTAKEQSALAYARDNGVLVVASSGNQGGAMSALGQASQPSDNLIVVGAANGSDRAAYSSYGTGLDLVAEVGAAGTSLAAAKVTGTIAKLWNANPGLSSQQVSQILTATATDLKTSGWDAETGAGLLNSGAAIALAEFLASQPQGSLNSPVFQNLSEKNQTNQDPLTGLVWQQSNDAIPSERTNKLIVDNASSYPGYSLKFNPSAPEYNEAPAVVRLWQQRMNDLGYKIDVDGQYGQQSVSVARQFQQAKGLGVDGIVGPQTWAASFDISSLTGSPISTLPNPSGRSGDPLSGPAQKLLDVARFYIGVQEQGNNGGAQVKEFQRAVDNVAQGEAWCMSFAQYSIKAAESATQVNSQVAKSEHCLTVWNNSPIELRRSYPEPGSLVIWQHGNSTSGHVGIVEAVHPDGTFTTIEGNTSGGFGNREGVYRKQRDMGGEGNMRVVGFLKVFPDGTSHGSKSSPDQGVSADASERRSQADLAGNASSYPGYNLKFNPSAPEYNEAPAVVRLWQQRMNDLGYKIDVDGQYGQQSVSVARQFQQAKGLGVDGIVGPKTWAASFNPGTPTTGSKSSPHQGMSADAAERWIQSDLADNAVFSNDIPPVSKSSPHQGGSADATERWIQSALANNAASYPGYNLKFNPSAPEYNEAPAVVRVWQQRMKDLGYKIDVNGRYGQQSVSVARQFQRAKGLGVDGIVDPQTWAASFSPGTPTAGSKSLPSNLQRARNQMPAKYRSEVTDYAKSEEALIRMHQEMIGNLDDIDKMRFFNSLSGPGRSLALAEFIYRVGPGGEWDHKEMLRDELGLNPDKKPGTTGDEDWYFPIEGNSQDEYNYDIWSNIHYGYVGKAAGFSTFELKVGADLADGGRRIPADDVSVRIGIELWEKHGSNLTEDQLRQAIIDHTDEYKRLQTEENTAVITPDDEKWNGK